MDGGPSIHSERPGTRQRLRHRFMPTATASSGESAGGADNLQATPQGQRALQNLPKVIEATFLKQSLIMTPQIRIIQPGPTWPSAQKSNR